MSGRLKKQLRKALIAVAPRTTAALLAARARAFIQRSYAERGCLALNEKILGRLGSRVITGPFAGLELTESTRSEHLAPYLSGTYECELTHVWRSVLSAEFAQILDIGAKFGFYAVGLARRFRTARVIAFDTDCWARKAIREMAAANQTPNVEVAGFCSREWLKKNLAPHAFILSDCEGYESVLFREPQLPAFASATLVIEIHEEASPGVESRITSAFLATHAITRVPCSKERELPREFEWLAPDEKALAVAEFRGTEQCWLWLEPLTQRR